ncbi:hypothetical protein [Rothia nasimurium]|uniref:ApeA N-terminal domain 1-containing protein n=1 Tax=Rothia nasimurium TaxID=85336 RepID=UPI001F1611C8|nr:hypothetical protein [Rothia nasimurium]
MQDTSNSESNDIRSGYLFAPGHEDDPIPCTLYINDHEIKAVIPLLDRLHRNSYYYRWFSSSNFSYADDPDRELFEYNCPRGVVFADIDGYISLVDCESTFAGTNFKFSKGILKAQYAAIGSKLLDNANYNSTRAEIEALDKWLGSAPFITKINYTQNKRVITTTTIDVQEIKILRRLNTTLVQAWNVTTTSDNLQVRYNSKPYIQTEIKNSENIENHRQIIDNFRKLIAFSSWGMIGYKNVEILNSNDSLTSLSGESLGDKWCRVKSPHFKPSGRDLERVRFLFNFPDIESKGIRTWFSLIEKYPRAFVPLMGSIEAKNNYLENQLILLGITIESLGRYISQENNGKRANAKGGINFWSCLENVIEEIDPSYPQPKREWMSIIRDTYIAIKHSDNTQPELQQIYDSYKWSCAIVALWVCSKIKVDTETIKQNIMLHPKFENIHFE